MKFLLIILVIILKVNCDKLKFIVQQYRHGARQTAHKEYFNNTSTYDSSMNGELTSVGQRQHYILGQTLREIYKDFLSKYNQNEFIVRSANDNRTLQSAQSQLYGLFPNGLGLKIPTNIDSAYTLPPFQGAKINQNLGDCALPDLYQPIPIHTIPQKIDPMIKSTNPTNCPNFQQIYIDWKNEKQQIEKKQQFKKYFSQTKKEVSKILQQDIELLEFKMLKDNIQCDEFEGYLDTVPPQLRPGTELYKKIDFVSDYVSYRIMDCPMCRKIANTNLFLQYIEYLDQARYGNSTLKWYSLSAHDTNLQFALPLLNITSINCLEEKFYTGKTDALNCEHKPPFAANLIIELHEKDDSQGQDSDFYVVINYNGENKYLCEKQEKKCQYSEWKERILNSILTREEHTEICGLNKQQQLFQDIIKQKINGIQDENENTLISNKDDMSLQNNQETTLKIDQQTVKSISNSMQFMVKEKRYFNQQKQNIDKK